MTSLADTLPDDPATLKAMVLAERERADRFAQIIKEMQRHRFGRRAETLPLDQIELGLEEVQQEEAAEAAREEKADPVRRAAMAAERRTNRGALPTHLPRIETIIDVEAKACPGCSGALHLIGEGEPCRAIGPSDNGERRAAGHHTGSAKGLGRPASQVRLPRL